MLSERRDEAETMGLGWGEAGLTEKTVRQANRLATDSAIYRCMSQMRFGIFTLKRSAHACARQPLALAEEGPSMASGSERGSRGCLFRAIDRVAENRRGAGSSDEGCGMTGFSTLLLLGT